MVVISCEIEPIGEFVRIKSSNDDTATRHRLDLEKCSRDASDVDIVRSVFDFVPDVSVVTALELRSCFLQTLPDCLSGLPLKELNVAQNFLRYLPGCLYKGLAGLEVLDVSRNDIASISDAPACKTSLRKLNVSYNRLNCFPNWFSETVCPNLTRLDVSCNRLSKTNSIPYNFFTKLNELKIRNCNLLDFNVVCKISCLTHLDVSNESTYGANNLSEITFARFASHATLKTLNVSQLSLPMLPDDVSKLSSLESLIASHNYLTELPETITDVMTLKSLDVSHNEIYSLPTLHLEELLASSNLLGDIPLSIKYSNSVRTLDLYENYLYEVGDALETAEYVDFEQNCFDTAAMPETYGRKKEKYRTRIEEHRLDGAREDTSAECESEAYSDSEVVESEYVTESKEENWDDYDVDDNLYLQASQFRTRPAPARRCLPELLDASYYEDSPYDTT